MPRKYEYHIETICIPSEGLAVLWTLAGQQLWTLVKTRKPRKCSVCRGEIAIGTGAFRPLTNGNNRYHRIHPGCIPRSRSKSRSGSQEESESVKGKG